MMYDAIVHHAKLKKGFVESGTEIVDAGGATEPYGLGHISFKQVEALAEQPVEDGGATTAGSSRARTRR